MHNTSFKAILRRVGQAISDYGLIKEHDRIAIGVSGGKDSLSLVYILSHFRKVAPVEFDLACFTVDPGWGDDFGNVRRFCEDLGLEYHLEATQIGRIVFQCRNESNPCALCANLRRGALNNAAKARGFNKVALAHHLDDAIETLFLSMFYEGRIKCFTPETYLTRVDLNVIRPLVYVPEALIAGLSEANLFPVVPSSCPAAGRTRRGEMKEIVKHLESRIPGFRNRMLSVLKRLWEGFCNNE